MYIRRARRYSLPLVARTVPICLDFLSSVGESRVGPWPTLGSLTLGRRPCDWSPPRSCVVSPPALPLAASCVLMWGSLGLVGVVRDVAGLRTDAWPCAWSGVGGGVGALGLSSPPSLEARAARGDAI